MFLILLALEFFFPPINGVVSNMIACFCFRRKLSTLYTLLEGEFGFYSFIYFVICVHLVDLLIF